VAHFVRRDVFDQAAHHLVGERQRLGARIERADLDEVPVAREVHDVVVELDVGLENLTAAWIVDVRSRRVLDGRRQPANDGVASVVEGSAMTS
jgi:hypothetical protein